MVTAYHVDVDDPRRADVRQLLSRHLAFAHAESPPEDVHALDVEGLLDPAVTFYGAREADGRLLGVGALRELDAAHAELKSMHTSAEQRGRGVGRALLAHLLDVAAGRGYLRVSLETGTTPGFVPARALYESVGFVACPPFGSYAESPHSVCMTRLL